MHWNLCHFLTVSSHQFDAFVYFFQSMVGGYYLCTQKYTTFLGVLKGKKSCGIKSNIQLVEIHWQSIDIANE